MGPGAKRGPPPAVEKSTVPMEERQKVTILIPLWMPLFILAVAFYLTALWRISQSNEAPPPGLEASASPSPAAMIDRETPAKTDRENPYPERDFQLMDGGLAQFQGEVVTAGSVGVTLEVADKLVFVHGSSFQPEPSSVVQVLGNVRRVGKGFLEVDGLSVGLVRPATIISLQELEERKARILAARPDDPFVATRLALFIQDYNSRVPGPRAEQIAGWITELSRRHTVDPYLVASLVAAESAFDERATSPVGAMGLGQLMPGTASELGVTNAYDPRQNLDGCVRYLSRQLKTWRHHQYSVHLALASYNAGPGAVQRYGGVPPYRETVTYVRRVLRLYDSLAGA